MSFVRSDGAVVAANARPAFSLTPPRGITSFTGLVRAYEAIYRTQPNVRTVVSFLGRNVAQLKATLYRRVEANRRELLFDHELARLLRRPDPRVSRHAFYRALEEDLEIFDVFVAIKVQTAAGRRALMRIPPSVVVPVGDNWLYPDGIQVLGAASQPVFPIERVVLLKGYNPENPRWGLSPLETLRRILAEDEAAGEYREQLWRKGARASGFLKRPAEAPKWSENARIRFVEAWEAHWAGDGPGAGGTPILEEGMEYDRTGAFTAQEAQYLEARKLTREEVAAAYHVHPTALGIMDSANISDVDANHRALYQDTLAPRLDYIGEELALQLIPDFDSREAALDELYIDYDLSEKLRGDFATEAEAGSRAVGGPWMTRNELRAGRNLPPLPGGDALIVPLNVTVGGRANPTDTAPGTPGLGQASRRPRALGAGIKATSPAVESLPADWRSWVEHHGIELNAFIDRQRSSVLSKLGRGDAPAVAFGLDDTGRSGRWDGELTDLLGGLALSLAPMAAEPVSARFDTDFDLERATAWLVNNARIAAETFNDATVAAVNEIWPAPTTRRAAARRAKQDATDAATTDTLDEEAPVVADAFAAALDRVSTFALDRVGAVGNFAHIEAARQGGATTKTWTVNSNRPRSSCAEQDGVTLNIGDRYSNGGLHPHDPDLSAAASAGCTCTLDFTEEPADSEE